MHESTRFTVLFRRVLAGFYLTFVRFDAFFAGQLSDVLYSSAWIVHAMPQKSEMVPTTLAELVDKMASRDYAFNFDITLEFNTPSLRVGSLRVHGRVESAATKRK